MKLGEILYGPETWCQGALTKGDAHCLLGAAIELERREGQSPISPVQYGLPLYRAINAVDPTFLTHGSVAFWNDEPTRTWEEIATVVETFDRLRLLAC